MSSPYLESGLPEAVSDEHRALASLQEELEAIDYYQQRAAVSTNPELDAILLHNRDEEVEHACMLLEWLRRNNPKWDEELRTYLFSNLSILQAEEAAAAGDAAGDGGPAAPAGGSLGIGNR